MRVLYVEDDQASARLLVKGLGAAGIEVTVAADGPRAIDLLRRESFDALILDIMMPGIDGLQVGRVARREGRNRQVPIILLTAHRHALREPDAQRLEPAAALTKPVKMAKLVELLRGLESGSG